MSDTPSTARERIVKGLRTPWGMAAILLALLLLVYAYQAWREGDLEAAFASHTPFTAPAFELEFSRAFPYDPLSFVGRGERADFWKWSQDGLVLTDHGRQFFEESGGKFVARTAAGTRRVTRITGRRPVAAGQQIDFFYEWTEVSAPAGANGPRFPPRRRR